jgi:hypothetical protein
MVSCADFGAAAGANAVEQTGLDVMVSAFDFSPATLERIKAGTQTMAIDQQPYLQGLLGDIYVVRSLEVWNRDFNRPSPNRAQQSLMRLTLKQLLRVLHWVHVNL